MTQPAVQIVGLGDTIRALRRIEPDAARQLDRELTGFAAVIAAEATATGARVPSNMPKALDRRAGLPEYMVAKSRRKLGATFGFGVVGMNYNAALAEFAGVTTPGGFTPQGAALIRNLDARFGEPGRIGWAAFDRRQAAMEAEIFAAVARAEGRTQRELDAASDRR
jgi:hypothetical protein